MSSPVKVKFEEAKGLLQEGDVLLFAGHGFISACIKMAGAGEYSHVAVASKHDDRWEAVEYREKYGGRTIDLENYVKTMIQKKTRIDVYRATPQITSLYFDAILKETVLKTWDFDGETITDCMRSLTGLPYSYKRLWLIFKIKLFKWRVLWDIEKITNELPTNDILYPVCSTVTAYCFSKKSWPLLKRKSDQYMEPSDISRSPRLNYLFTLDI